MSGSASRPLISGTLDPVGVAAISERFQVALA
jgi:hypothetical protein